MRVAVLSPLFESVPPRLYGGTERVVFNLCRGLEGSDIEAVLFASGDSVVNGALVPVVDESLRLSKNTTRDPVAFNLKMLAMIAERANEFDLIHNHHDYWMLPLTRMTDVPVLTTLHGRMDLPDLPGAFLGYPNSSYVSISDSQRVPVQQLNWIKTIHHGIDLDNLVFHEKQGSYLAFLGRIYPEKKPEWAIEMAFRSGVPLKIAAKIEGKGSQEYFDALLKPHIDGKFIEYVGEISEREKSEFLGNALALAFPIDWPEPFGLVVIESLACGTPVLARPCGSVPELLQDGVTGYSRMDLKALSRCVKDIPKIDRKKCREWAEKRFSLKRMTEDYIDVYRHVVAQRFRAHRGRRDLLHSVQRTADGNT